MRYLLFIQSRVFARSALVAHGVVSSYGMRGCVDRPFRVPFLLAFLSFP